MKDPFLLQKMPLMGHLQELRQRLLWCLLLFVGHTIVCYIFAQDILVFLTRPLAALFEGQIGRRFIYTGLTEAFMSYLKAACFAGLCLSCPWWAFHLWRFISQGLYPEEQRSYRWFFLLVPVLFFTGATLAYTVVCPCAWKFFLSFESTQGLVPLQFEARISEYLGLMLKLMSVFGLGFQLPIILALCVLFRLISLSILKQCRKYAFLIITVVAALITPPDLISPLGLILPMYGLYEMTLFALSYKERSSTTARLEKKNDIDIDGSF